MRPKPKGLGYPDGGEPIRVDLNLLSRGMELRLLISRDFWDEKQLHVHYVPPAILVK
jgi:hypothetical protein